jgi:MFS family permease
MAVTKTPGLLSTLRNRDFALFASAFTTSSIGAWAYNVALVVWLLDATGSPSWVAAATAGRFVPALLFSAYGGVIAERFERVRLMFVLDLIAGASMVLMAVEMYFDAAPVLVVMTAAVASVVGTAYQPAAAALTPQLVPEKELGAANALRNTIDNVCVIAGPGLGAVLLLAGEPWLAVAVNALTYVVSAGLTILIRERSTPVDVTEGGEAGPLKQMQVGMKAIASSASAATLVAYSVIATIVFGIDTVLFVVLSRDILGTGAEGYGYLLAGLGVGGVVAAGLVTRLERLPKLGTIILLGMAAYCLPTLVFLAVDEPVVAFIAQVVRGAGTLVVDVLAITALQRTLPNELLGRVFGAFETLVLLAVLFGSVITPLGLSWFGLDAMIVFAGLGIPLLCLIGLPWLRRMDQEAVVRRAALAPKASLLIGSDLFASVSEGAIDQLAGTAEFVEVAPDTVVVRQGEPADAFYVIESGDFAVSATDETGNLIELPTMGPGTHFGEIGLIENTPRTATVTARTAARVLKIDGEAFIQALTQAAPSTALLDGASLRLRRTQPRATLSQSGLGPHD